MARLGFGDPSPSDASDTTPSVRAFADAITFDPNQLGADPASCCDSLRAYADQVAQRSQRALELASEALSEARRRCTPPANPAEPPGP